MIYLIVYQRERKKKLGAYFLPCFRLAGIVTLQCSSMITTSVGRNGLLAQTPSPIPTMGKRMINYSVYMLPNQMDESQPPKAYAKAQVKEVMNFRQFVAHIAEHSGHKRGQVKGVLSDMCSCLVEQLLEGKKIVLDDLGNFWLSLSSEGAESCEAFTAKNITGVRILFTPGEDFENLLGRAAFNPVPSRAAQLATLKAEKTGETTVDLATAKGSSSSTLGGNNDSAGTGNDDSENGEDMLG